MKIYYIIVAIILLGYSCEDSAVAGVAVLNNNEAVPVTSSENASTTEPVAKPKILVPKISENSNSTQISPDDASKRSAILKPILEPLPRVSTPMKPADGNANESVPVKEPQVLHGKPLTKTESTVDDTLSELA